MRDGSVECQAAIATLDSTVGDERLLSAIDVLHAKAGGVEVEYQIAAVTSDALFNFIEIGSGLGAVLSCSTLQSVGLYYS